MVKTENVTGFSCLFCKKTTGVVKRFENDMWAPLLKLATDRSKENLAGEVGVSTDLILEYEEIPDDKGYHVQCHRKYWSVRSSKRKRNPSDISNDQRNTATSSNPVSAPTGTSNTLVAQIFSVASRTFADLSDLVMQLHPQEDLQSKYPKYTREDVDLLYRAVSDFGDNIKQVTENLRQRHTDRMRYIQSQGVIKKLEPRSNALHSATSMATVQNSKSTSSSTLQSAPLIQSSTAALIRPVAASNYSSSAINTSSAMVRNTSSAIVRNKSTNQKVISGFSSAAYGTRTYPPTSIRLPNVQPITAPLSTKLEAPSEEPSSDSDENEQDFDSDDFGGGLHDDEDNEEIEGLEFEDDDDEDV